MFAGELVFFVDLLEVAPDNPDDSVSSSSSIPGDPMGGSRSPVQSLLLSELLGFYEGCVEPLRTLRLRRTSIEFLAVSSGDV